MLAIAAYNAGETNVNRWVEEAGGADSFEASDIPFPETRHYVDNVAERKDEYREHYARRARSVAGSIAGGC